MAKYEYMVCDGNTEYLFSTLKEARKKASEISKVGGLTYIQRWSHFDNGYYSEEPIIDDYWMIEYEDGKDISKRK